MLQKSAHAMIEGPLATRPESRLIGPGENPGAGVVFRCARSEWVAERRARRSGFAAPTRALRSTIGRPNDGGDGRGSGGSRCGGVTDPQWLTVSQQPPGAGRRNGACYLSVNGAFTNHTFSSRRWQLRHPDGVRTKR